MEQNVDGKANINSIWLDISSIYISNDQYTRFAHPFVTLCFVDVVLICDHDNFMWIL